MAEGTTRDQFERFSAQQDAVSFVGHGGTISPVGHGSRERLVEAMISAHVATHEKSQRENGNGQLHIDVGSPAAAL